MSPGNRRSIRDHDSEALDDYTTASSTSNESSRVHDDAPLSQSYHADKLSYQESNQPASFQQVVYFLSFTLKESALQTLYTIDQTLRCTWLLLRELPKPCFDAFRVLLPLWLCVIHAISLVLVAVFRRIAGDALREAYRSLKTRQLWTDLRVLLAFPRLASHSNAVLSSPAPLALSNTTSSPCLSMKTAQLTSSSPPL